MIGRRSRMLFWGGLLIYGISFGLKAVSGHGVLSGESPSIARWVFDAFLIPLIFLHWNSWKSLLEELNIAKISLFFNGWINPLFLLTTLAMLVGSTAKLTRVLQYVTLLIVPFCWVVLLYQEVYPVYPHEGYILWTLGMALVLSSTALDNRQTVADTSCE